MRHCRVVAHQRAERRDIALLARVFRPAAWAASSAATTSSSFCGVSPAGQMNGLSSSIMARPQWAMPQAGSALATRSRGASQGKAKEWK